MKIHLQLSQRRSHMYHMWPLYLSSWQVMRENTESQGRRNVGHFFFFLWKLVHESHQKVPIIFYCGTVFKPSNKTWSATRQNGYNTGLQGMRTVLWLQLTHGNNTGKWQTGTFLWTTCKFAVCRSRRFSSSFIACNNPRTSEMDGFETATYTLSQELYEVSLRRSRSSYMLSGLSGSKSIS